MSFLSGSPGKSSSAYLSNPINLQNSAFTGLSGPTAGGIQGLFSGAAPGSTFGLSPYTVNGAPSNSSNNPLVAGLTPTQNSLLTGINNYVGSNPLLGAAQTTNRYLDPNFPSTFATSPQVQQAIQGAIAPVRQSFAENTVPGLEGQFTAAGQRINSGSGAGSSAFERAGASAATGEQAQEASISGGITGQAFQQAQNLQANAVNQAAALTQTNLNDLVTTLQENALPQMIQQYGINQGLQLYQQQLQTVLAALGLGGQVSQPAIAEQAGSTSSGVGPTASPLAGIGSLLQGVGNVAIGGNYAGLWG